MRISALCLALVLTAAALPDSGRAADIAVTKRARNDVREGPGSYYPLLLVLPAGRHVETLGEPGPWIQVRVPSGEKQGDGPKVVTGWMSRNCFTPKEGSTQGILEEIRLPVGSVEASPAYVAAAVRGFALRYLKATEDSLSTLDAIEGPFFGPEEYLAFVQETIRSAGPLTTPSPPSGEAQRFFQPYAPSLGEEAVGAALAVRVIQRGLAQDRGQMAYVNLVGSFLAEQAGSYDFPFRVVLLRGSDLYAMAVPGGILFLTQGMLLLCQDESELAAVIAHEMMHVLAGHGLEEIRQRSFHVRTDLAQWELEKEMGPLPEADPTLNEIESIAIDAYEAIEKPRLQAYEVEADRGALLLLARAGYDPSGLVRMVSKIRDAIASGRYPARDNPFLQMDFSDRAERAAEFIRLNLPAARGARHQDRFRSRITAPPVSKPPAANNR